MVLTIRFVRIKLFLPMLTWSRRTTTSSIFRLRLTLTAPLRSLKLLDICFIRLTCFVVGVIMGEFAGVVQLIFWRQQLRVNILPQQWCILQMASICLVPG